LEKEPEKCGIVFSNLLISGGEFHKNKREKVDWESEKDYIIVPLKGGKDYGG
jgi:hypothetical protein